MRMLLIGLGAAAVIACSGGGDWIASYANCLWEDDNLRAMVTTTGDTSRDLLEARLRADVAGDPDTEQQYRTGYAVFCGGK